MGPCFVYFGLAYEIYSGGGPPTYVYCVVCYCVIAAYLLRKVQLPRAIVKVTEGTRLSNQSCFVYSGLVYEIYSGGGPPTYVYCVVCYCVIAAPYVRNVGHVFAYLYSLNDDWERQMDYERLLLFTP